MPSAPIARAMGLMAFAMVLVPLMDVIAKHLGEGAMAPGSVALGRFVAQLGILLGVVTALHRRPGAQPRFRPAAPRVHLTRGALHGGSSLAFFVSVKYMPVADAIAVFFVEPMILLGLSALFLGEVVGWPRRIAAVIGFLGALLVVQPSYELFGPVSLLPLLAALLFAGYLAVTRRFADDEHPLTMQIWSAMGASALISIALVVGELAGFTDYQFTLPATRNAVGFVLLIGLISSMAHIAVVIAFSFAPASVLAPFNYLEIVSAVLFGYLVFQDFPGGLQWIGISIIVATGVFIYLRERHLERLATA